MHTVDRALVLGPGGRVGTAWMAGLACGLSSAGTELAEAGLIVGTSAGAIVGAVLASGRDPGRMASPAGRADAAAPARRPDPDVMGAVFAVLGRPGQDPAEARRRVGRIALDHADADAERALLAQRAALVGTGTWPGSLLITAVDAATGEPVVWDRTSGVPLAHAVAASSAFPGVEPPVAIGARHYVDGALRAGTNADLAAGARTLVVLDPLAHRTPGEVRDRHLAALGAGTAVTVAPDPVLDVDQQSQSAKSWEDAYRAGLDQAPEVAGRLASVWKPADETAAR